MNEISHCSKSSPAFSVLSCLGFGHGNRCVVLSHYCFNLQLPKMATHSSVLAWRIPGTGEPGGLPSMGSHRVGHNWSDLAVADTLWLLSLAWMIKCSSSLGAHAFLRTDSDVGVTRASLTASSLLSIWQWSSGWSGLPSSCYCYDMWAKFG